MTQTVPAAEAGSLYEQVGGADAVRSDVGGLCVRTMSDQRLAPPYPYMDVTQQKRHMAVRNASHYQVVTRPGDSPSEREEVI